MNNHWKEFRLRVNIDSPIEKLYNAWASPAGLQSWFLRKALFTGAAGASKSGATMIETGDEYEWFWHGYPDTTKLNGKITQANGKDLFSFSFSKGCLVSISLFKEQGESMAELVETNLSIEEGSSLKQYVEDYKGWIFYLTNLKSVLEGGLDLRNRKLELTNVITA